jgi:hypothetical protein
LGAAAATAGHVPIADGAGSAPFGKATASNTDIVDSGGFYTATQVEAALQELFTNSAQGWGYYSDNAAEQTFGTTATKLLINALDSDTEESYLPREIRGSDSLWDNSANKIDPIEVGDAYQIRLDLPITTKTSAPTRLTVQLDISSGSTPATIHMARVISVDTITAPFTASVAFPIFITSTFNTNNGQIFLSADTGSVGITGPSIFIERTTKGSL